VDGIECLSRITGKWLTRAVNYLARNSQHLPMRSGIDEMRPPVGSFGLCQFLERHCPQQDAITLDKRQVGRDDCFGFAEQPAHRGCSWLVEKPCQHRTRLGV
jgi:hypothetical protein